jgi:hypothetical protein
MQRETGRRARPSDPAQKGYRGASLGVPGPRADLGSPPCHSKAAPDSRPRRVVDCAGHGGSRVESPRDHMVAQQFCRAVRRRLRPPTACPRGRRGGGRDDARCSTHRHPAPGPPRTPASPERGAGVRRH